MSIYRIPGCAGEICVGTLPSGDLTVKGYGDSAVVALARAVAMRHYGRWNEQYRNWIVPKSNSIAIAADLARQSKKVG